MMSFVSIILLVLFAAKQGSSEFDNIKKLALGNNELAFKLHKTFTSQGNVITSPVSIFTALAMLYQGARGITAEEMREMLCFNVTGLNDENINQNFQELLSFMGNSSDECKLDISNAIVSQSEHPVLWEYKDTLETYYDAILKEANVIGESAKAIEEVNSWARNKTKGKIQRLLKSITNDTVLVLLNAIYFKCTWKTQFAKRLTRKETFYNDGVHNVTVLMMATRNTFFYGNFSEYGFQAVKIPYKDEGVSMVILLPFERLGLTKVEEELTSSKLDDIVSGMTEENLNVKIPKFKLKGRKELKLNLASLGMKSAFTDQANFTGISREGNLEVSKILHRAVVDVKEEGSEAAGATAKLARHGNSEDRPKPQYFTVNHPFVFFIRDDRTGMILFYGRVSRL